MKAFVVLAILLTVICVLVSACATTLYVDGSVSSSGDGTSWETAFKNIQEGVDAASDGDTVTVAEGTYVENIEFKGKNIVLKSTDPLDPSVVASTIIDGNKAGSVVTFSGTETEACVLFGFTIQNGEPVGSGGGICGGGTASTHATIQNNTITGNSVQSYGGGLCFCDGPIQNNTITGNSAPYGGGLMWCDGTIQNNAIIGNLGTDEGGGLYYCDGTIRNNTISGNLATGEAGGLFKCNGTIESNTITNNSADWGGGLFQCTGTIRNNTISGNRATYEGGGLYRCTAAIESNTIAGNSADWGDGGGLYGCSYGRIENNTIMGNSAHDAGGGLSECWGGTIQNNTITGNLADWGGGGLYSCKFGIIRNCMLWANTALIGPQIYESSPPTYCCIQEWSGGGEGNITSEPGFLDLNGGDYRLQGGSPCIDAGHNDPALPAMDIAGMHRIMYGGKSLTVDVGAYEYYVNSLSRELGGNAVLTWSSLAGKSYRVERSSDILTWETAAENVPSVGDTVTTWTDTTAPFVSPDVRIRYYRTVE